MSRKTTLLNQILGSVGLAVFKPGQRLSELQAKSPSKTAGLVLEFIGTQGIGKTTLNDALYRKMRANWFVRADLGQKGRLPTARDDLDQLHRTLYFDRIARLHKEQPDAWKCFTVSRQMSNVISESLTILSNTFPRGFMLDESLFKNFPSEVLALDAATAAPLWNNRAFIHLRARDAESVVERYNRRVQDRARNGALQSKPSDEEIRERVASDNEMFDLIVEKAASFDCPALVVYAEDDVQTNVRKVLEFEDSLRK